MSIRDTLGDPANGDVFLDALDERFAAIWNGTVLHMTSVGGTANAVTATVTPAVGAGGYQNGMVFSIVWAAANTVTNVTLNSLPVVTTDGSPLAVGALDNGLVSVLVVVDDEFRVVTPLAAGVGVTSHYHYVVTTVGANTFTLPTGLDDDAVVEVELWAGGGGGYTASSGGGGGGGGYISRKFRVSELPSSLTLTIGAGGAAGAVGGNTTFGTLLTAYGGGAGGFPTIGGNLTTAGGGGGGTNEAGTTAAGTSAGVGGFLGGGNGGVGGAANESDATSEYGGGGGGSGIGGRATYGGGGGGGQVFGSAGFAGGTSLFGGNGGAATVAGSAPAGGGGRGAAGARGEARIHIYA